MTTTTRRRRRTARHGGYAAGRPGDRPRHHRHDLRVLLGPHRAQADKLDGVEAVVNLATEKATVRFTGDMSLEKILETVRNTGYGATVIEEDAATTRATR